MFNLTNALLKSLKVIFPPFMAEYRSFCDAFAPSMLFANWLIWPGIAFTMLRHAAASTLLAESI